MVRVLHVFKVMDRGGAETMIMNLYRKIDKNKIQFDFLCMDSKKGDYDDEIKELGGKIYVIAPPSKKHIIKHINDIKNIFRNYDVVHIPNMFYSGFLATIAKISGVKKIIVHSHSAFETNKNTILRKMYRGISRILINIFATNKISCGKAAAKFLFGTDKNILILNNAVDIKQFIEVNENEVNELRKDLNIDENTFVIGNVSRFVKEKNHEFFIELAKYLKSRDENAIIVLVGDGERRKYIENLIKENELEKYIKLVGKTSNVNKYMKMFSIFVLPSFFEGFPVVLIEAVASNLNSVVSDNISKEVEIVEGTVKFCSLNVKIEEWYNTMINFKDIKKYDEKIRILREKGFSVEENTEILTKLYLK